MKMNAFVVTAAVCLFTASMVVVFLRESYAFYLPSITEPIAGPTLLYPTTEDIDLSGDEYLVFRWERIREAYTDHYIFKLYKGYGTYESALLERKDVGPWEPIRVPVDGLERGQVYSWSLQQVMIGGHKSDRSFSSFMIIKE